MYWVERMAWEKIALLDKEFDEWEYSQVIEPYSSSHHKQNSFVSKWMNRKDEERKKEIQREETLALERERKKKREYAEKRKQQKKRIKYANSLEVGMFASINEDYAGHWLDIFENHTNFIYNTVHIDGCVIFSITGINEKGRS